MQSFHTLAFGLYVFEIANLSYVVFDIVWEIEDLCSTTTSYSVNWPISLVKIGTFFLMLSLRTLPSSAVLFKTVVLVEIF